MKVFNTQKQLFSIIKWINNWFLCGSDQSELIKFGEVKVNMGVTSRGIADTCKRIKHIQLHVLQYLGGNPLYRPVGYSLSINKKGIPISLGPLTKLIDKEDPNKLRLLLTLLNVRRAGMFESKPNINPIVNPTKATSFLVGEAAGIVRDLGGTFNQPTWEQPHVSSKAGPNGLATISCFHDLDVLPDALISDLHIVGGSAFAKYIDEMRTIPSSFITDIFKLKPTKSLIRKLSIVNDPEGKARIIAILDYGSQSALLPLHNTLFKMLRKIKSDCTFNQLSHKTLKKGPYYSIDLTAATDRFPVKTQVACLAAATGSTEYAEAWERIMVDHEFYAPWDEQHYKYNVGQPMGAYSSWPMFAFTHHVIVRLAAKMAGKSIHFDNYILLGDDIVIGGKEVAIKYMELLTTLGVDYSPHKTHISDCLYEFAKRVFFQGTEISGAQVRAFLQPKGYILTEEARNLTSRFGMDPTKVANPVLLRQLLALFQLTRSGKKAIKYLNFPQASDSQAATEDKVINFIQLYYGGALGCTRSQGFLKNFILQTISEIKTAIVESALKTGGTQVGDFQQKIMAWLQQAMMTPGMTVPTAIMSIPQVRGPLSTVTDLQQQFDKLRSSYGDNDQEIVLSKTITMPKDPNRIMATRAHQLILASQASMVNKYSHGSKEYLRAREFLLSSENQPDDKDPGD